MKRINSSELLDTDDCPAHEVEASLRDMARINRWFGGVSTSVEMIRRVARATGMNQFSLLEVASGLGELPKLATRKLARDGITLKATLLDRAVTHLPASNHAVAGDALALPFPDGAFDLVGSNLFAHHLEPSELVLFVKEALRVSRFAVLINDLVRHPMHIACVYAGFPLMRSRVSRVDGLTSVRRAYIPQEIRNILGAGFTSTATPQIDIFRSPLFRMGVIIWKHATQKQLIAENAEYAKGRTKNLGVLAHSALKVFA